MGWKFVKCTSSCEADYKHVHRQARPCHHAQAQAYGACSHAHAQACRQIHVHQHMHAQSCSQEDMHIIKNVYIT